MRFSNQGRFREQVRFLKRQFLQDGSLPFGDTLTNQIVAQAMTAVEGVWKDRIYSPRNTVGLLKSGLKRGPFVSCSRIAFNRPSPVARRERLLRGDGCLLPSQKTTSGKVLF